MPSHPTIPTVAGIPTRAETYSKLMYHMEQCEEMCAVISHLHNTEDNPADRLLARSWLQAYERLKMIRGVLRELAMRRMQ